jgi:hypothetical protein
METLPYKEIIQLGGLAVVALGILYILFTFIKEHRKELDQSRNERQEAYKWFTGYVQENNHDQTERFKEHTKALVDTAIESTKAMNTVAQNIETNTIVTKKTLEILDQHSRILEKLYDKVIER